MIVSLCKDPLAEVADLVRENESMAAHTTFRIGGPARYFAEPRNTRELRRLCCAFVRLGEPVCILGAGSNLLVSDDGVNGAVISLKRFETGRIFGIGPTLLAGAGVPVRLVADRAAAVGLSGLEEIAGVPGTVGGAISTNAGSGTSGIGALVERLYLLNLRGEMEELDGDCVRWEYRKAWLGDRIVVAAMLRLVQSTPARVFRRMEAALLRKKSTQPVTVCSAGCVFKNPDGQSAGALMELVGLKGIRLGGAMISRKHANFVVNVANALAADVLGLMELARSRVAEEFGVWLEPEVCCWA